MVPVNGKNQNNHLNFSDRVLLSDETFRFSCHEKVTCYTKCCRNADMYVYPFDIIRLKNRLAMTSDEFLKHHTFSAFRDNPYFPNVMLKMSDSKDHACPFLSPLGCKVYEDRPYSCRTYPLEPAVSRIPFRKHEVLYYMTKHSYCKGHRETKKWTVKEWIADQKIQKYDEMNLHWVEIDTLFRNNPWGDRGVESPALKMAFMACFNVDKFKTFIFESSFLKRFALPKERVTEIEQSDEKRMIFGFNWVKFFLTGRGSLKNFERNGS